ncbi:MAG: DNA translocase FtsK 4TM domain-containing protein [Stellaceae bacterium]
MAKSRLHFGSRPRRPRLLAGALREGAQDWADTAAVLRRHLAAAAGFGVLIAAFLLLLCLFSYDPRDPSWDTAVAAAPHNLLGRDGAFIADLLRQLLGLAAFLLPAVLFGWAFRLLLNRPLTALGRRLTLLPLALLLGAFALTAAEGLGAAPTISGGAVGWLLGTLLGKAGLGPLALPLAMAAAALVGLLLLMLSGLSWQDWRDLAAGTGRGTARAASLSGRGGTALARFLRQHRRARRDARRAAPAAREPTLLEGDETAPANPEPPAPLPPERAAAPIRVVAPAVRPPEPARPARDLTAAAAPVLPAPDLLARPPAQRTAAIDEEALARNARMLETVLEDFGVRGGIVQVRPGPVVTLYEFEPAPGIKASRIIGLADDIARSMSAISVRVAVVPGRTVIGIELPNRRAETVYLRELLESPLYEKHPGRLALILGKDIGGEPVLADLARMPHLLIAGTTGSGKSVWINTMILSILYRLPSSRCKFIMIDPKMLELSVYDGIPHLLAPVVTDAKKAILALKWTVREMETRYRKMSRLGVRNIDGFNARVAEAKARGEALVRRVQTGFDAQTGTPVFEEQSLDSDELPLIVVVVDEMADLMLVAGKEIEAAIQRLAQMARAAGIHLIMATQRPSVDVITGTIKANFPTRISFQVTSKIDSRTILGEGGAEQLLGRGDMLFMAGGGRITRVHGPFVSDEEVERVVSTLKAHGAPDYIDEITEDDGSSLEVVGGELDGDGSDSLYDQAVAVVCHERKASTSFVQRHLQIGYNRAARIIERMEAEGVVSPANHVGKREVLARGRD